MPDLNQDPLIKVIDFKTTFERLPVKAGPLDDNVDIHDFKLDTRGKRLMEMKEVDWVLYAPAHSPINTQNWERIKHIEVTDEMLQGEVTEKLRSMKVRWDQVEPRYRAWKAGHEVPLSGTPLAAWPGITPEKAEVLRRYQIRTVEDVRDLVESQLERIQLPNMRDLRKAAGLFLEGRGAAEAAERETERDNEIVALKAQLAETNERFAAAMDLLEAQTNPATPGSEIDHLRQELDAKGIKYHHKAGAETLRSLLNDQKAA